MKWQCSIGMADVVLGVGVGVGGGLGWIVMWIVGWGCYDPPNQCRLDIPEDIQDTIGSE